jgi:hypothetical protein
MSVISRFGAILGAVCALVLSGCNSSGSAAPPATAEAAPSISGTVKVVVGGRQGLSLPFAASDSSPITNLTVTSGLSPLPAGWSGDGTFTCASVVTGNGCTLDLTFAPTAVTNGTLVIRYTYTNSAGVGQTGSISVPYASTSNNNVTGSVSPSGQVAAMVGGGSRVVTVTFDTDDGNPTTAFAVTTNLTGLPAGWSSAVHSLSCSSVSTGNGCQLALTFTPTTAVSGSLTLDFGYVDASGTAKTGTLSIPYASTSNDNVVATSSPSGQVNAVVSGNQALTVTFTTDDGKTATSLSISASSLNSLPSGWSSSVQSLSCATVSTGNACQLHLSYAPTSVGGGSLHLPYSYTNNAGTAKTGTANISYAATTHDNVSGTASPSGSVSPYVGLSQAVTVIFTTDDGNPASSLSVTSGLGALPAGWTGAGSFDCSTVSSGTGCQLTLTYSPTTVTSSGSLNLNFSFLDDAGTSKTGSVSIPYSSAWAPHVYVGDPGGVWVCSLAGDQSLSSCALTGSFNGVTGIAFNGNFAYVSEFNNNVVYVCAVATDGTGTLSGCTSTGSGFNSPVQTAVHGSYLYVPDANGGTYVTVCAINATDGTLSGCGGTAGSASNPSSVAFDGSFAYVNNWAGNPSLCTLSGVDLINCATTAGSLAGGWSLTAVGGYAYVGLLSPNSLGVCTVGGDGSLTGCSTTTVGGTGPGDGASVKQIALIGNVAYLGTQYLDMNTFQETDHIYVCSVSGVTVSGCAISDGGASFNNIWSVAEH